MEKQSKKSYMEIILILISAGIWIIVLQNAGIIPTNQNVKVVNTVDTHSEVSGSVSVNNTVGVNIQEINGYNTVTTGNGTHSVFPYGYMLPVDKW